MGPLPKTAAGNRYIVTLMDYFSKFYLDNRYDVKTTSKDSAVAPDKDATDSTSRLRRLLYQQYKYYINL